MNFGDNDIVNVPHLEISIEDTTRVDSILKTVSHVKPQWHVDKIKMKVLTDGNTNKLVLCTYPTEGGLEDNLLVRIYGHNTDLLIDRKAEIRNIKALHYHNLAPALYATFENGLVYEYIPGNTVSPEDVTRPEIYKLIAREMAKMHKVKVDYEERPVASLWSTFQTFIDLIPDEFEDEQKQKRYASMNFTKSQLLQEIQQCKESVNDLEMPVVLAHNDLILQNIIYNRTKNKISFIDFEFANFNYQPFDIGNHFAEYAGVSDIDFNRFPKKELQLDWLRTYLMEYKNVSTVCENEVEILYVKANKFVLAAHLFWYSWCLIQAAHSHLGFNFIQYGAERIKEYIRRKSEFLSLQLPKSTI